MHAIITYDYNISGADYQKQSPSRIRVEDSVGALMRLRQGHMAAAASFCGWTSTRASATSHSYTSPTISTGTSQALSDPRGHTVAWSYDDQVHTYATLIRSYNNTMGSPEYDSSIEWDYTLGKKTAEVDQNGQRMSYAYDIFGRLVEVEAPTIPVTPPAVSYQYNTRLLPLDSGDFQQAAL